MHRHRSAFLAIVVLGACAGLYWLGSELTRPLPPTPTITPTPAPTKVGGGNGLIAFTSDRDGNSEIYVMNADGSNQRNLTQNAAVDTSPSWSPDGQRIAFISISNRLGELTSEVFIMQADGTNVQQLTRNGASEVYWSPDGSHLLTIRFEMHNTLIVAQPELVQLDGTLQPLALPKEINNANSYAPQWSPDGLSIGLICNRLATSELYVIPVDGSPATRLDTRVEAFTWSPNGTQLAWTKNGSIWLAEADGSHPRLLKENLGGLHAEGLRWSPDGLRFAFSVLDETKLGNLALIWADGSNLVQLPSTQPRSQQSGFLMPFAIASWSPDSQWLMFTANSDGMNYLYSVNFENAFRDPKSVKAVQLTTSGADYGPVWQPQPRP